MPAVPGPARLPYPGNRITAKLAVPCISNMVPDEPVPPAQDQAFSAMGAERVLQGADPTRQITGVYVT